MPSNTLVIVALVGLAVICLALFAVMFVFLLRFTGRNFMSFLALMIRGSKDDDNQPTIIKSPKPDLRSLAQAEDFDSALARQSVRDTNTPPGQHHYIPTAAAPTDQPFDPATPRLGSRRTEPYKPVDHDTDDPIFGDLLNIDGDLDV